MSSYDSITESTQEQCLQKCQEQLLKAFGPSQAKLFAAVAPGRVNIIGGHVDYCGGFVLPFCLGIKTYLVGRKNGTRQVNIVTSNMPATHNQVKFDLDNLKKFESTDDLRWANYPMGVVAHFHNQSKLEGFDLSIHSEVPLGGGLSSSASCEVGTYTFLEAMTSDRIDGAQKALNCQKAEHTYAGMPCGIMDQYISANGQVNSATLIDCDKLAESHSVTMPNTDAVFLITNTNVKHELTGSEYPERRAQTETAAKACGEKFLRYVSMEQLDEAFKAGKFDEVVLRRAQHVVEECRNTLLAKEALQKGDYQAVGDLMSKGHDSLSNRFNVSCPESDKLMEISKSCEGVFGGRMTGGGFGGCTIMIVDKTKVDSICQKLHEEYLAAFGRRATFYVTAINEGAREISL